MSNSICVNTCGSITTFILFGLIIGFGIPYLIESDDTITGKAHLWIWCLITLIIQVIIALYFIIKTGKLVLNGCETGKESESTVVKLRWSNRSLIINAYLKSKWTIDRIYNHTVLVLQIALAIWGCIIYNQLKNDHDIYSIHIWTWFMVMFICLVIVFSLILCAILCVLCALFIPEELDEN
jgi:MFS family permease